MDDVDKAVEAVLAAQLARLPPRPVAKEQFFQGLKPRPAMAYKPKR